MDYPHFTIFTHFAHCKDTLLHAKVKGILSIRADFEGFLEGRGRRSQAGTQLWPAEIPTGPEQSTLHH